jgi:DNA-binding PucR family transcriptional regulator
MLVHFPVEHLDFAAMNPELARLFVHRDAEWLVRTLESFLDSAGDVKATAGELFLHRASLYYRLRKIEELAKVDLGDGKDRLALHLGLKLARMAGVHPLQHLE